MMNKAIENINRMEEKEFNKNIYAFQMEALREQQLAAEAQRITEIRKAARLDAGEFELRCMKCDNFAAISTDFRQIKGTHHVVVDKDFFKRVHVEPHPNPIRVDFYIKQGKIFCKECRYDWGIKAVYKNVGFPVLKISSFVLVDSRDRRDTCKKWKNAPFAVTSITPDDLQGQFESQMEDQE